MPEPAHIWSILFSLPTLVVGLAVGFTVAVFTFVLNRIGSRYDSRALSRRKQPSRRNLRAGRRFLSELATRGRRFQGPARWSLTFNSSLAAYEVEQHGPDVVHDLRIDFFDTRTKRQSQLSPTIQVAQLPPGLPLTMALGAITRIQHYGLAIRWDDRFGTDQFERLRIKDAWQN